MTDIPRCEHGHIILGCPEDDCRAQGIYLAEQQAAIARYERYGQEAAREYVRSLLGLPE